MVFEEFGYVGDLVLEERGEERFELAAARPDEPFGEQWDRRRSARAIPETVVAVWLWLEEFNVAERLG